MFANLIESDSHRKEFKRRSSFFLATTAAYALILFAAGIGGIYAYDARLESQSDDMTVLSWIPPITNTHEPNRVQTGRRISAANNSNRIAAQSVRPVLYESPSNPIKPPIGISTLPNPIPPALPDSIIGRYVADRPTPPGSTSGCATCSSNGAGPPIREDTTPPPAPIRVKPQTQRLTSTVLASKAISLPQPPYPPLAKQIHVEGTVAVQILVGENGKVISAQALSGHPMLTHAAADAALRALFTPTLLNGQPVKVQGVITYNFVLR